MQLSTSAFIPYIQERLKREVCSRSEAFNDIITQPLQGQGKMLRPQIVMLCSSMFGQIDDYVLAAATAIECIHTASLVHDDIIDQARLRRGMPTAHHLYGPKAAVLIGDHFFASAFELLTRHRQIDLLEDVTRAIKEMCEGEISQDLNLFNPDLTETEYFQNIYGKTAALFASACRCGALAAKARPDEVEMMGQFGESLGYAYQMTDDILDLTADEKDLGKPVGSDLSSGIITLPVIRALVVSEESHWLNDIIRFRQIDSESLTKAVRLIIDSGAIGYAMSMTRDKIAEALGTLSHFKPTPARHELEDLCRLVTDLAVQPGMTFPDHRAESSVEDVQCSEFHPSPGFTGI